jgi:hypothetical protein
MLGSASCGFRRRTRNREDIQRVRRRFGGVKRCSEAFVRIRGVDRRPARTGCRPRSALRWIRSLSCAGTLSLSPTCSSHGMGLTRMVSEPLVQI